MSLLNHIRNNNVRDQSPDSAARSQSIDWYAEGGERIVEANGIRIVVRFVGRKGRRGRIAITAPPGAAFLGGIETGVSRPSKYLHIAD